MAAWVLSEIYRRRYPKAIGGFIRNQPKRYPKAIGGIIRKLLATLSEKQFFSKKG